MTNLTSLLVALLVGALAAGCGEGFEDGADELMQDELPQDEQQSVDDEQDSAGALSGQLVGQVSGVAFETATQIGVTDSNGTFRYAAGESVRFSLGATVLGETDGKAEVTLFDLVGIEPLVGHRALIPALKDARHPLQTVVNLAVFLQTLDLDGDADNGIEITEEVASLFEDVEVSFAKSRNKFAHDRAFRSTLTAANEQRALEDHRAVRNAAIAMGALYRAIQVDAELYVMVKRLDDTSATGTFNQSSDWFHDDNAFILYNEHRYGDLDGVPDTMEREYDANGNELRLSTEARSGVAFDDTNHSYDEDGNRLRTDRLRVLLGERELNSELYAYDAFGNQIRHEVRYDGFERNYTKIWDDGNLIAATEDTDADGQTDISCTFEYNAEGLVKRMLEDSDSDGNVDRVVVVTYDDAGRVIRQASDEGVNGTFDEITSYVFNAKGQMVRVSRVDSDGYGGSTTFTYAPSGDLVRTESDNLQDGVIDGIHDYEYDEAGNLVGQVWSDGAGKPQRIFASWFEPTEGWANLFAGTSLYLGVTCGH